MKFAVFTRKAHWWIALVVLVPLVLVVSSGLLLQVKKQWDWVQPPEMSASASVPALELADVLDIARGVPEAGVREWSDIARVDLRPSKNLIKITTLSRHEIQVDAATGAVLQVADRRSDLIESLHDGSFFGEGTKLWVFLPVGLFLFLLLASGTVLLAQRWRRRSA